MSQRALEESTSNPVKRWAINDFPTPQGGWYAGS